MNHFLSSLIDSGMNYYKSTKMLAEKECIEFSKTNNINLTVLSYKLISKKALIAYIKSMRPYYFFVSGMAGWLGIIYS